jgi:hypothetical protein
VASGPPLLANLLIEMALDAHCPLQRLARERVADTLVWLHPECVRFWKATKE